MLKRRFRLKAQRDFKTVYRSRQVAHSDWFSLRAVSNQLPHNRLAVVISTKVAKQATRRNRLRRQLVNLYQKLQPKLKTGKDLVLALKIDPRALSKSQIETDLRDGFKRLGIFEEST